MRGLLVDKIWALWNRTFPGEIDELWESVAYRLAQQSGDMIQQVDCPWLETTVVRHAVHDEDVETEEPGLIDVHP
jgi:hypothetical protein